MKICTRFAPSPTGFLHLGNLRTALFNALLAYQTKGNFLLRIEDTDLARSKESFAKAIGKDLHWLGLTWSSYKDQKVVFQSKRQFIYAQFYKELEAKKVAYPCFCSEARLDELRQKQKACNQAPGYDGHCRDLSDETIQHQTAKGEVYHLRLKVPDSQKVTFQDCVKGSQSFNTGYLHDFVIQKSDKTPSFLYCNALDDALMGVTHVLRGEDHLTNTVKQLLILEALELKAPSYGHLPLVKSESSTSPLSKRDNSFGLDSLQKKGYLPEAIVNYLARLGHTITSSELMTVEELSKVFFIENIHISAAHFDESQLNFWQKQAIRKQSSTAFWNTLSLTAKAQVPRELRANFIEVMQEMVVFPKEVDAWALTLFADDLTYNNDATYAIQQAKPELWSRLIDLLNQSNKIVDDAIFMKQLKDCVSGCDRKDTKTHWKAVRAALTNTLAGPDMLSVIKLLGVLRAVKRLKKAATLS